LHVLIAFRGLQRVDLGLLRLACGLLWFRVVKAIVVLVDVILVVVFIEVIAPLDSGPRPLLQRLEQEILGLLLAGEFDACFANGTNAEVAMLPVHHGDEIDRHLFLCLDHKP
jgi:hypothetical protein